LCESSGLSSTITKIDHGGDGVTGSSGDGSKFIVGVGGEFVVNCSDKLYIRKHSDVNIRNALNSGDVGTNCSRRNKPETKITMSIAVADKSSSPKGESAADKDNGRISLSKSDDFRIVDKGSGDKESTGGECCNGDDANDGICGGGDEGRRVAGGGSGGSDLQTLGGHGNSSKCNSSGIKLRLQGNERR